MHLALLEVVLSSTSRQGHMSYCHHLVSIVMASNFQKSSPQTLKTKIDMNVHKVILPRTAITERDQRNLLTVFCLYFENPIRQKEK